MTLQVSSSTDVTAYSPSGNINVGSDFDLSVGGSRAHTASTHDTSASADVNININNGSTDHTKSPGEKLAELLTGDHKGKDKDKDKCKGKGKDHKQSLAEKIADALTGDKKDTKADLKKQIQSELDKLPKLDKNSTEADKKRFAEAFDENVKPLLDKLAGDHKAPSHDASSKINIDLDVDVDWSTAA